MRTQVDLNEALINQVVRLGRFPSRQAAIHRALAEYARLLKRQQLLTLRGQVAWVGDLDQMRANREDGAG